MKKIFILFFILISSNFSYAEKLMILHTNDLHGYFENTVFDKNRGGYARIKSIFDEQKRFYASAGITESLVLDAGDFMEGNLYYLAKKGRRTWGIMNEMGYDAVVLGNHDWLMGARELSKILLENPPKFAFLGANVKTASLPKGIRKNIIPYKIFKKGKFKVAVIGGTTSEILYRWLIGKRKIVGPVKKLNRLAKKLKKKGLADYVIALTHIGKKEDKKLVKEGYAIDLIVGGHSHSKLSKPIYEKNEKGYKIPIVQTGAHGNFVGRLLLDMEKNKPLKVLDYQLIDTKHTNHDVDEKISSYVKKSNKYIHAQFKEEYLNEIIGFAEDPLISLDTKVTPWTAFVVDAIRESVDAEVSIHAPALKGANLPVGPLTRKDIFNSYPRVFKFKEKRGWPIWRTKITGMYLGLFLRLSANNPNPLVMSGVTFDVIKKKRRSGKIVNKIRNIKVNGRRLKRFKRYSVAIPHGLLQGAIGVAKIFKAIFRSREVTKTTLWDAIMKKVIKERYIGDHYTDERHKQYKILDSHKKVHVCQ